MNIKPTPRSLAKICLPAGAAIVAAGAHQEHTALALGGFALIVTGLTSIVIDVLTRAICETNAERRQLHSALATADEARMRYLAARKYFDDEKERLCRVVIQLEHDAASQLASEREELMADIEDKRSEIKREGFDLGLNYNDRGIVKDALHPQPDAKVFTLPVNSVATTAGKGTYSPS